MRLSSFLIVLLLMCAPVSVVGQITNFINKVNISNGLLIINSSNTIWNGSKGLNVGLAGSNREIPDGVFIVGESETSSNNQYFLTNAEVLHFPEGNFIIGYNGSQNEFFVGGTSQLTAKSTFIGYKSSSNSLVLSGNGTILNNTNQVIIGIEGSYNQLGLKDGASLNSGHASMAYSVNSISNSVRVVGKETQWSNYLLMVGAAGSYNSILIAQEGMIYSLGGVLGNNDTSSNNSMVVAGKQSRWIIKDHLNIGGRGNNNSLHILDGGKVSSSYTFVSTTETSHNNQIIVEGNGSHWVIENWLQLGQAGSNNLMVVTNGGRVTTKHMVIGMMSNANNNILNVSGKNSIFEANEFILGQESSGNKLIITEGGQIQASDIIVGHSPDASHNTIILEGPQNVKLNFLSVGFYGSENSVLIKNGSSLKMNSLRLGENAQSKSNTLVIDGGKLNTKHIVIGNIESCMNSVTITNGSYVESTTAHVGTSPKSTGNLLLVGGANTILKGSYLHLGGASLSSTMKISDGAVVLFESLLIGEKSHSGEYLLDLDGLKSGLIIRNPLETAVLNLFRGKLRVSAGEMYADFLFATNKDSIVEFDGGKITLGYLALSPTAEQGLGSGRTKTELFLKPGIHRLGKVFTVNRLAELNLSTGTDLFVEKLIIQSGLLKMSGTNSLRGDLSLIEDGSVTNQNPFLIKVKGSINLQAQSQFTMDVSEDSFQGIQSEGSFTLSTNKLEFIFNNHSPAKKLTSPYPFGIKCKDNIFKDKFIGWEGGIGYWRQPFLFSLSDLSKNYFVSYEKMNEYYTLVLIKKQIWHRMSFWAFLFLLLIFSFWIVVYLRRAKRDKS